MEEKMETTLFYHLSAPFSPAVFRVYDLGSRGVTPIVENQMEKKMENDMATALT